MINKKIINNWADALYNVGTETKSLDLFRSLSLDLIKIFKTNPTLINFLGNNHIHRQARKEMVQELFVNQIPSTFVNALKLLIDRNLFLSITSILKRLIKQVNNSHNVQYGTIYSVIPLSSSQIKVMEDKVSAKLQHTVILQNKIDESLIGGIRLESRNYVIDGSLRGELESLKHKVILNK